MPPYMLPESWTTRAERTSATVSVSADRAVIIEDDGQRIMLRPEQAVAVCEQLISAIRRTLRGR